VDERSPAAAQARYWHLKQVAMFGGLPGTDIRRLGEHSETGLVEAGQHVYQAGDPADSVYVLKSGRIKVTRAEDGKELILYFVSPGEILGELTITGCRRRSGTATALEDAFICAIGGAYFEELMLRHPKVAVEVVRVIGGREERAEKRALEMISKDVPTRLAHMLVELAADFGERKRRGVRLDLPLTQSDLAQLVGSTRETVSTVFNEFRRAGLVDSAGRTIWVLDPGRLEGYSLTVGADGKAA